MFGISVVIPTYNRSRLVQRALGSVLCQTRLPKEVIVVDDGSEDKTGIVIRENYPSVRYLRKCHCGVSAARNAGIHVSTGEWITFLDSDDVWLPTKLEAQFQALASNPHYRVIHTDEIWIRNGRQLNPKKKHRKHGGKIFLNCLALCCISPSSVLIHRSVFTQVGGFDKDLPVC